MIKPGMLIQWKSTNIYKWGWYYKDKPTPIVSDSNYFERIFRSSRVYEENLTHENRLKLVELENKKKFELSQVKNDENKSYEIKKIHAKYSLEEQELEDQIKLFNFQYALMVIEKLVHNYKIGNVTLKNKVFWKCMLTKRSGETEYIWVEDEHVEPFVENSYEIKNILLTKHLARRAEKKK